MNARIRPSVARQRGIALVTALLFLVILTVLGLAAMRAGNIDLKLSQNENDRMTATETAQTAVDAVRAAGLNVLPGSDYLQSCYIGGGLSASALGTQQKFTCPAAAAVPGLPTVGLLPTQTPMPSTFSSYYPYWYVSVRRESANGADYLPVSAIRQGDSSDQYSLAWFTITGGYDRISVSDSSAPQGGAEVIQGVYVKVAKIRGYTQQ